MTSPSDIPEVLLEVVAYDPVRRLGFMRAADAAFTGRVHFALGTMPETFKRPIIERSKPISSKRTLSADALTALVRDLRKTVVGTRFRAKVRIGDDGRRHLVTRSILLVPAAAAPPLHFWDLGRATPTYSCGAEPVQGENNHVIGDHRDRASIVRFAATALSCHACLTALRTEAP